jgi:hypothetical protein
MEGVRQFLIANIGAREAYEIFQQPADALAYEILQRAQASTTGSAGPV